jgi:putative DNA primase/helicase
MHTQFRKDAGPKFELVAIADDEKTEKFFGVIEFTDVDGKRRTLQVSRADLDDRKQLLAELKNAGARLSPSTVTNDHAIDAMMGKRHSNRRWTFARTTGWRNHGRMYVRPKGVIGKNDPTARILPPCAFPGAKPTKVGKSGTLEDWKRSVAMPARHSSRFVFGICAALAATILRFSGLNSFGILISGRSKLGKTTMLLAGASVIGIGSEEDLPNFRITDAALAELPAEFNDNLLPVNELGLLKGRVTDRQERFRAFSYGFAEGTGTTYSNFFQPGQSSLKWSCIALATSEESADQIAASAGEVRMSGEAVRCIDLPATHAGATTMFDLAPKNVAAGDQAAWDERTCVKLRRACKKNHGIAQRRFVQLIIPRRKSIRKDLELLSSEFIKRVVRESDGPVVRHLARSFGHICAAGVLGVRLQILPWDEDLVLECMQRCFTDARAAMNTPDDLLRAGLRIFDKQIHGPQVIEWKTNTPDSAFKEVVGYWVRNKRGYHLTLSAEGFKSWYSDVRQPALVLKWLAEKGALARPAPQNLPKGDIRWAQCQPVWPDGNRPRSITIDLSDNILKAMRT